MSPEEVTLLQHAGGILLQNLLILLLKAVFFGAYIIMATITMINIWQRRLNTKYTTVTFIGCAIIMVAYTVSLTCHVAFVSGLLRGALIDNFDLSLKIRLELANSVTQPYRTGTTWLEGAGVGIFFWVGDAVVVWRANAMFPYKRLIKYTLIILYLCGIALSISFLVLSSIKDSLKNVVSNGSLEAVISDLSAAFFISMNGTATLLIAQQTYNSRKLFRAHLETSQSKSLKIMILLTESGFIYCGVQMVNLVLSTLDDVSLSTIDWACRLWSEFAAFASATFPIVVIQIINRQTSITNIPEITDSQCLTGPDIHFGRNSSEPARGAADSLLAARPHVRSVNSKLPKETPIELTEFLEVDSGKDRAIKSCP